MVAIFVRTLIIYILLSLSLKLMGKRQIGELEVSELISTLVVSEVASLPIADPDIPLSNAIIPVLFIVTLEILISFIKNKSEKLKRHIEGEPIFIFFRGRLIQSALKDNRISINEVMCEMRNQSIGDINEVYHAILEQNGKLSFLKKSECESISYPIIIDGEASEKNLTLLGYQKEWLDSKLKESGKRMEDIFLMTVNEAGNVRIIEKDGKNERD